uniref:N-alpha-acetyltransferase 60 n=1 Tax=Strigamia maritima TaxID=126957 RepID=T1JBL5_STRMM
MSQCVPLCHQSALQLRFLNPEDRNEVQNLCTEWFPIEYPESWYREITHSAKFYSLAAIYEHRIIGLIVAELKPNGKCHKEDQGILSHHFPNGTQLAYILSLGVVQDYRRNGIASLLLDNLIAHLTHSDNAQCKAIYLHVLTSNTTAIKFYERRHFKLHTYLPFYYSINGIAQDGYSYVLYLNGGHPPWTVLYPFRKELIEVMLFSALTTSAQTISATSFVNCSM